MRNVVQIKKNDENDIIAKLSLQHGDVLIRVTGEYRWGTIGHRGSYDPRWLWHAAVHLGATVKAAPQYLRCQTRQFKTLFDS